MARKKLYCPHCKGKNSDARIIIRKGGFRRACDSRWVKKFFCKVCRKYFSYQTTNDTWRHKKINLTETIRKLLTSGISRRQIARMLGINKLTVERKFYLIAKRSRIEIKNWRKRFRHLDVVQFDEMESHQHTKLKPVSIPLVVTEDRYILSISVTSMKAKGHLAKIAAKKYAGMPPRKDGRGVTLNAVLGSVRPCLSKNAVITSDECPRYPLPVKKHFPEAEHIKVNGGRGCIAGYGELKKKGFDPMFALNHTAAMIRDRLATMRRRTWTSTKKMSNLLRLLQIYACEHNRQLAAAA